ncbi:MAG: OsmC family protein [Elusimicrobiaceae bacterium]|nr:OsmC family protein [Elusimicrobiaceae bacterium]
MSSIINCSYTGNTRVYIKKEGTADILHTAHDNKQEFVTPGDMLVAALGACTLTMMSVVAEKAGEKLDGANICLNPHFGANLEGLQEISLHVIFPAGLSETVRKKCLAAAKTCPVHKSLNPNIKFSITAE